MKESPTITVEVAPDGQVIVEVSGVQGPTCQALTKELEQELGSVKNRKLKPENTALDLGAAQKQGLSLGGGGL